MSSFRGSEMSEGEFLEVAMRLEELKLVQEDVEEAFADIVESVSTSVVDPASSRNIHMPMERRDAKDFDAIGLLRANATAAAERPRASPDHSTAEPPD